jgi:hypothetical protein
MHIHGRPGTAVLNQEHWNDKLDSENRSTIRFVWEKDNTPMTPQDEEACSTPAHGSKLSLASKISIHIPDILTFREETLPQLVAGEISEIP